MTRPSPERTARGADENDVGAAARGPVGLRLELRASARLLLGEIRAAAHAAPGRPAMRTAAATLP